MYMCTSIGRRKRLDCMFGDNSGFLYTNTRVGSRILDRGFKFAKVFCI